MKFSIPVKYLRKYSKFSVLLLPALLLTQCIDIDSIDQQATIQAGEILTATVHVHISAVKDAGQSHLVVGFLAPKKWNAAAGATLSYTSNKGSGTMSLVPAGLKPFNSTSKDWATAILGKAGIGKNKIRDLEWVVFWSDKTYDIVNGDDVKAAVTVKALTGKQNMIVDLGYFAACSTEDINGTGNPYGVKFATLETTGGEGALINYLVPQMAVVDPVQNLDNEFMTLTFDGSLVANALTGASGVFLYATAYTHDHQTITVSGRGDKEKMTGIDRDKWRIDMWPRKYFKIADGQAIDSMKYYFTNQAGDKLVKQPDSGLPFLYVFACQ